MIFSLISTFNYFDNAVDIKGIIDAAKPYVTGVTSILIAALIAFSLFKIILLAKDLAAAGDDPQRRSEIKKAFMYTLIAPIIGIIASTILLAIVLAFHGDGGIIS